MLALGIAAAVTASLLYNASIAFQVDPIVISPSYTARTESRSAEAELELAAVEVMLGMETAPMNHRRRMLRTTSQ